MNQQQVWRMHSRLPLGPLLWSLGGVVLATAFHVAANLYGADLLKAVALRLYYVPILYGALAGGLTVGGLGGVAAALLHLLVMYGPGHTGHAGHGTILMTEHLVEIPFFLVVGLLTGALRDHEQQEKRNRQEITETFGRYVSHQVVDRILSAGRVNMEGEETEATVLFTDLRNFTGLSENLRPHELLRFLNLYFEEMVEVILAHDGFLDKFIGDGIMAVFGVPLGRPDDSERAVRVAIEMIQRVSWLNAREPFSLSPVAMRIGISTGTVVAGSVGSTRRMEYTVMGDTVNVASRLESLNKIYGSEILISDTTYRSLGTDTGILVREVDAVRVKGRSTPCVLFEVFSCCPPEVIERKRRTLADFMSALQLYKSGDLELAGARFQAVLGAYPDDPISRMYMERIDMLRKNKPAVWDGVYEFTQK